MVRGLITSFLFLFSINSYSQILAGILNPPGTLPIGSFVQGNTAANAGNTSSVNITNGTVGSGHLVVTCASWLGIATYSVSDGTSSFTTVTKQTMVGSPDTTYTQCAYLLSSNPGAITYQESWSAGVTQIVIWIAEFSATKGTWHLLATSGGSSVPATPSTASSSGSFSPNGQGTVTVMDTKLSDVAATTSAPLLFTFTPTEFPFSPMNTYDHKYYLLNKALTTGSGSITYSTGTYWTNIAMSFSSF